MPLLRKKERTKPCAPRWHERARALLRRHPIVSWSTIPILLTIGSAAWHAGEWVENHYMTRTEARRNSAWSAYRIARLEEVIMRNRVNECEAKQRAGTQTAFEYSVCSDYRIEYGRAAESTQRLQKEALESSK